MNYTLDGGKRKLGDPPMKGYGKEKAIDVEFTKHDVHHLGVGDKIYLLTNSRDEIIWDKERGKEYEVVSSENGITKLALDNFKQIKYFILDHSTLKLIEEPETPIETKEDIMSNAITPLQEIAGYNDKQNISGIEGVLVKIYEPKSGTNARGGRWFFQDAEMVDDDHFEHKITFRTQFPDMKGEGQGKEFRCPNQGKRFQIFPAPGKPQTLRLAFNKDPQYPNKIEVDAGCRVELRNGVNPVGPETGNKPQSTEQHPQRQHQVKQMDTPVKERVELYFKVLSEVYKQYSLAKDVANDEGQMPDLSASDLKDIATHISMTYRGDYGSYAPPIFDAVKSSWRDIMPPNGQKTLGEHTDDDLRVKAIWALQTKIKGKAVKEDSQKAYEGILEAAKEKGWNSEALVWHEAHSKVANFDEAKYNNYLMENQPDWDKTLVNIKQFLEDLTKYCEPSPQGNGDEITDDDIPF